MGRVITLALEAATYAGSVAVLDGRRVLADRSVAMRGRDREALMPAVAAALREAGHDPAALGRIVCGAGPGAFTSLRIAGGIAKGLALAAGIPLVPVSSLALVVAATALPPGRYLAAIDAMRGELYAGLYDVDGEGAIAEAAPMRVVRSGDLSAAASALGAAPIGPTLVGAASIAPRASGVARLDGSIHASAPADLARWEPAYGRLAEAQVVWETAHGRPLGSA